MAEPKIFTQIKNKANIASPSFTGTPIAPTPATGTNNTQLATTAFVKNSLSSFSTTDTKNTAGSTNLTGTKLFIIGASTQAANPQTYSNSSVYISTSNVLMGAAWNDFAEFRCSEVQEPGRVICETGDGTLELAEERLQPGANIISDTFGFAIGQTDICKTPVAVAGRVLTYTYEDRENFCAGDPVCAAPNGTISKMTRKEVQEYPDRIIGTVSEIPQYDYWGPENEVEVKNRIWIKIK